MPYREPEYKKWLEEVCFEAEKILACEATVCAYGLELSFTPLGQNRWRLMFEEKFVRDRWCRHYNSKSTAYEMAIGAKEEWDNLILRRGEYND